MPSTKDIRRRISSVKNTRQITKAMEMVAAAKMRRTQAQAMATRTYARLAWDMLKNVSSQSDQSLHKLLFAPDRVMRVGIVLITSNRGLIGGFNNNLVNAAIFYAKKWDNVEFITLGKRGRDALAKRGYTIAAEFEKLDAVASVGEITSLSRLVMDDFMSGKYDRVSLVYMDFISTLIQRPHIRELLPLVFGRDETLGEVGTSEKEDANFPRLNNFEYLFEPSADKVLEKLLPRLVEMQIYQAVLETNASEHSARMVAMKNASSAAQDLIGDLVLEYNQLRQAAITREISEIVGGQLGVINQ